MRTEVPRGLLVLLQAVRRGLTGLETLIAGLSLLLLVVLTLAQTVARNGFDTGLPAVDALARQLVLYVMFFGAALATDAARHIRIDVVSTWCDTSRLDRFYRPLQLVAAAVCALFTDAAVRFWLDAWQYAAQHDRWQVLLNLVIPVGFGLLAIHFLLGFLLGPSPRSAR
ncbi:MAG: TRAP transporter small permease [Gammaproteobacteria bacterium]|nr:TRAP transporter small permease [Gammaproteobacteria bacterium]